MIESYLKLRLNGLSDCLKKNIKGQPHVISKLCPLIIAGELNLRNPSRPKSSFLFVGPTGVGKTETAITFTEHIFGSKDYLFKFDMSEFQNQSSVGLLLGQKIGEIGLFGQKLGSHNKGTILFDEIEKAHPLVLDLLLQILDSGCLTLADGKTRNLSNFYIVCTSNIGAAVAAKMKLSDFSTVERRVQKELDKHLRQELLGRFTEKIVFNRLTYEDQLEICVLHSKKESARLKKIGYTIEYGEDVEMYLIREGIDMKLGARPLRDCIEKSFQHAIAVDLLNNGSGSGLLVFDSALRGLSLAQKKDLSLRARDAF